MYQRNYTGLTEKNVMDAMLSKENASTLSIEDCSSWNYDHSTYQSSIVTQWHLVCNRKALASAAQTTFILGLMLCSLIYGQLADRFGRKPCLIGGVFVSIIFGFAMAFSPNYIAFLAFRIVYAMGGFALYQSAFLISIELVGPKWRSFNGTLLTFYWVFGYVSCAGTAYLIRDWPTLQWVTVVPLILCFSYIYFIPESPRWLISKGRIDEAMVIIEKIAKSNKKSVPDNVAEELGHEQADEDTKANFWHLFRYPNLRKKTFVVISHWATVTLVYYGLSLNAITLGGNDYVNFAINGAVELPGCILGLLALQYIGRRWPLAVSLCLCGICILGILAVPADVGWARILLAMSGKMLVSCAFAIVYVYTGELFPTVARAIGFNTGNFFGRFAGLAAPFLLDLGDISELLPPIIMGSVSILGGLTVIFVPETHKQNLPETIQDAENFGKRKMRNGKGEEDEMVKFDNTM